MPRFMKAQVSKEELIETIKKETIKLLHRPDAPYDISDNEISRIRDTESLITWLIGCYDSYNFPQDLQKVDVTFENVCFDQFLNVHGSTVALCYGGGDWETPVYFVVYVGDDGKIRFYIPSKGNTYCHKCKTAWGSCECGEDEDGEHDGDTPDMDLLIPDIENRLQTK